MIQGTDAMDRPVAGRRWGARRIALPVGALIVVAAFGAFALPSIRNWMSADASFDLSRLRLGRVVRGDLERDLSVQGRVVAAYHPTTFSPASGIVSLHVRAGDVVERGEVLAEVDGPELRSRLEQERSALLSQQSELDRQEILAKQRMLASRQRSDLAEVELEAARRAMARAERSRAEGIVNEVDYEDAADDLRRAELGLEHARQDAELEGETIEFELRDRRHRVDRQRLVCDELERQVGDLEIRAPVEGLVSRLDVNDRDAVTPGQSLITVVDLSAFEIEVMIPESYADEIGAGTPAVVRHESGEYDAVLKSVSPEVEGSQVRGIVAFTGASPEGLRQNQRLSTRLVLESRSDVLKVARGPFLDAGGGREAYVVEGGIAVLRPIRTGVTSVDEVEIVDGLSEGEEIVVSDTTRFEAAERVYLRR